MPPGPGRAEPAPYSDGFEARRRSLRRLPLLGNGFLGQRLLGTGSSDTGSSDTGSSDTGSSTAGGAALSRPPPVPRRWWPSAAALVAEGLDVPLVVAQLRVFLELFSLLLLGRDVRLRREVVVHVGFTIVRP